MILSFSIFKEKIESGEKCQSIRKYSPGQYRKFLNCWKKRETTGRYNLFWHNPRNGGIRIKDVVPSDKPQIIRYRLRESFVGVKLFRRSLIDIVDEETGIVINPFVLAKDDGFENDTEMHDWFFSEYGSTMYDERFMVLRWLP